MPSGSGWSTIVEHWEATSSVLGGHVLPVDLDVIINQTIGWPVAPSDADDDWRWWIDMDERVMNDFIKQALVEAVSHILEVILPQSGHQIAIAKTPWRLDRKEHMDVVMMDLLESGKVEYVHVLPDRKILERNYQQRNLEEHNQGSDVEAAIAGFKNPPRSADYLSYAPNIALIGAFHMRHVLIIIGMVLNMRTILGLSNPIDFGRVRSNNRNYKASEGDLLLIFKQSMDFRDSTSSYELALATERTGHAGPTSLTRFIETSAWVRRQGQRTMSFDEVSIESRTDTVIRTVNGVEEKSWNVEFETLSPIEAIRNSEVLRYLTMNEILYITEMRIPSGSFTRASVN
uniref:Uncharacterized protein n=1 Tax=viral metagenome TaxID=1070528 RepID=A0A2V0RC11_9ZZZZ